MTLLFKCLVLSSFLFFAVTKDCKKLTDGSYEVKYFYSFDSTFVKSKLEIRDDSYSEFFVNSDSSKGKIKWLNNCCFKLNSDIKPDIKPDTTNANELSKLLTRSFGEPCFEIKENKGDTLIFRMTFTGGLHITSSDVEMFKVR
jgi:hypothetical protein